MVPHADDRSPLDVLDAAFRALTAGPAPLALDGRAVGHGLPRRPIPLDELRSVLLHPSTPQAARDAALGVLLRRARAEGGRWTVGLAGVLLPGLRRVAGRLAAGFPGDTSDLDAELLTGLLEAVQRVEPGGERLAGQLLAGAHVRARRYRRAELERLAASEPAAGEPAAPPRPAGHPDLVLARAVAAGSLPAEAAELIARTRLEGASVQELAAGSGLSADALRHRRWRAERRLLAFLQQDRA